MAEDILNDAKSIFYDSTLYAMEGENPEKAIDNYIDRGMKTAVTNCMIPIRVNHVPKEHRLNLLSMDISYEEREKLSKDNKRKYAMEQYAKMGIIVLEEDDDGYMCKVQLPDGWKIERVDSYWSNILDNKGRKRINFFYKSAFWDIEMHLLTFYADMEFLFFHLITTCLMLHMKTVDTSLGLYILQTAVSPLRNFMKLLLQQGRSFMMWKTNLELSVLII